MQPTATDAFSFMTANVEGQCPIREGGKVEPSFMFLFLLIVFGFAAVAGGSFFG